MDKVNNTSEERCSKRRKISLVEDSQTNIKNPPSSLERPISPPPLRRSRPDQVSRAIPSQFQLTTIRDLPASSNVDTVTLKDILGDPLIAECWEFNYLHDVDFLMDAFDSDVRDLVKVHVVHGNWKQDDPARQSLMMQASKYPNVTLHTAYMPEIFGTHHSKMLILLRHDCTAQVVIHTANMIAFDWANMTQGLWRSPLLPELTASHSSQSDPSRIGSGSKFKIDLVNYLKAYDTKRTLCKPLIQKLVRYDFSEIRAALVASVPGRQDIEKDAETSWGWPGLMNILNCIPMHSKQPEIVVQISSIATLGQTDKWLGQTLFKTLGASMTISGTKPKFRIIFPSADEVRRSLNGYSSGSAIHTKIQTAAQRKQLDYLKPMLCYWAGDGAHHSSASSTSISDAGRKRAAPHIKTYIRFADSDGSSIDWMLLTSANLSKQAWGEATNSAGEVRISSYEIGVIVWPELFGDKAKMIPTFKTDTVPTELAVDAEIVVGARMPYDIPHIPYAQDDKPWCASSSYTEPDWMGKTWNV